MAELIHNLGIEWKVLVAQIINFAILLFVLKKFAYGPIIKMLDERKRRIEDNIEKAKHVEEKMAQIERLKEEVLAEARKGSELIIKQAEASAQRVQQDILAQTHERSERILAEAEKKIAVEREKLFAETKHAIAELVVLSVEKTVGDVMDKQAQTRMAEEALRIIRSGK